MTGKAFGEWVNIYEQKSSSRFEMDSREELFFAREHGFFTWMCDFDRKFLLIPKMCGDGKYLRPIIYDMLLCLMPLGFTAVLCCYTGNPRAYMRILGGELYKQEREGDKTYSWILITPENTNVKRR